MAIHCQGSAHVARRADGGWALDNLSQLRLSPFGRRAVTIGSDQPAHGTLSFGATNFDDLSPLILTKLSGAAQAKWRPRAPWDFLNVDMTVDDLWADRGVSGQASWRAPRSAANRWPTSTAQGDASGLDFSGSVGVSW